MTIIEIRHRWTNEVLYTHKTTEERQASGLAMRDAVEAANLAGANIARANLAGANLARANLARANLAGANLARANLAGANLARANLAGAYLAGANLDGAYLAGANLAGANLDGANLDGAYLAGADLARANLARANLDGANLARANLDGANGQNLTLVGSRPVFQIGPIGSRCATLTLFLTDGGPMVRAGCFWGSLEDFEAKCESTHGDTEHGREYALASIKTQAHAELWTPAVEQVKEAA